MFGIIFVVLGHGASINKGMLLGSVFPYYSFHMALFAFVSGYFFKDIKCIEFLKKKTKKLSKKDQALLMENIEEQMREAAKNLDFERAMELRDILFEMKTK